MLWTLSDLLGYEVHATDGNAGHVRDVYFSDDGWHVRSIVVELGGRWRRARALVPPEAVTLRDAHGRRLSLAMTTAAVAACPSADTAPPVSAQMSRRYRNFVAWPALWLSAYASAPGTAAVMPGSLPRRDTVRTDDAGDRHLRSASALIGSHVIAGGRDVGHLRDFALTGEWRIASLLVEVGGWRHHRAVLVPPYWVERFSWPMASVFLSVSPDAVLRASSPGHLSPGDSVPAPDSAS